LGGDVERRRGSGELHWAGIENASRLSTPSTRYCSILQPLLYLTVEPNIDYTLMLANMPSVQGSPRYNIRQRRYWVI